MNLFELFVKIGVNDQASKNISKITEKLGNGLKTAAKIGTTAIATASTAIATLTTMAVKNYAEYEQLVGGVDTLFKDASQKVQQYAANAYKTAGMSANDYMANATAFSASLISALGDDTEAAAEYANRAMVSMSDNANKMGTNIDSIVQTYQSLARGNFAMLDNLKLGYGGTKAELERLIADASTYTDVQKQMGVTVDKSSMSFDNIVNAIAVVQGKLGIAGATALEAGTTIEGSVNSMKAAWTNLVTGFADGNADIELLIEDLVETIVGDGTESNLGVIGNVLPAVERAFRGIGELATKYIPIAIQRIPEVVSKKLPLVIQAGTNLLSSIIFGISESLPDLVSATFDVISTLVGTLTSPESLEQIFNTAFDLIVNLISGLFSEKSITALSNAAFNLIGNFLTYLTDLDNIGKIFNFGNTLITEIGKGIVHFLVNIEENLDKLINKIANYIENADWKSVGKRILQKIGNGLGPIGAILGLPTGTGGISSALVDYVTNPQTLEYDYAESVHLYKDSNRLVSAPSISQSIVNAVVENANKPIDLTLTIETDNDEFGRFVSDSVSVTAKERGYTR